MSPIGRGMADPLLYGPLPTNATLGTGTDRSVAPLYQSQPTLVTWSQREDQSEAVIWETGILCVASRYA